MNEIVGTYFEFHFSEYQIQINENIKINIIIDLGNLIKISFEIKSFVTSFYSKKKKPQIFTI